ncbi:MAG: hypothetical protein LBS09_04960 [Bacteroidales bacterium]|nr:hypothetical protein [Bacteroidales bacterium]
MFIVEAKDIPFVMLSQYNTNVQTRYVGGAFQIIPESPGSNAVIILSPSSLYNRNFLTGPQLFLRLSLLAVLLALFLLFCRRLHRLPVEPVSGGCPPNRVRRR